MRRIEFTQADRDECMVAGHEWRWRKNGLRILHDCVCCGARRVEEIDYEGGMMGNYTAEDFAQANLATRGDGDVARRANPSGTEPWHAYGGGCWWFSDEEMAAGGWVPVVE